MRSRFLSMALAGAVLGFGLTFSATANAACPGCAPKIFKPCLSAAKAAFTNCKATGDKKACKAAFKIAKSACKSVLKGCKTANPCSPSGAFLD